MDDPNVDLIERWRGGDQSAATDLWNHYADRLVRLTAKHLSRKFKQRLDPDDVVQSVFHTMFRRARAGKFDFKNDDDLWNLLVAITLNKVRNKIRHHLALRRDPSEEYRPSSEWQFDIHSAVIMSRNPSVAEAAEFADLLEALYRRLSPVEGELLTLRLEGLTQEEIAAKSHVDVRTVRRRLDRIRERLTDLWDDSGKSADPDADS